MAKTVFHNPVGLGSFKETVGFAPGGSCMQIGVVCEEKTAAVSGTKRNQNIDGYLDEGSPDGDGGSASNEQPHEPSSGNPVSSIRAVIPDQFVSIRKILVSKVAPWMMICRTVIGEDA